ncbi:MULTISPECIES: helix-turn-helix domain-containing protein [unclassified Methanoculleus]|uniref:helix-turn-helix domain-containing protein n=1 Tax=unclassified Methanoculleus TaxID=2619537 RepID=UPI0032E483B4
MKRRPSLRIAYFHLAWLPRIVLVLVVPHASIRLLRGYRYRLYPTADQTVLIRQTPRVLPVHVQPGLESQEQGLPG